MVQEEDLSLDVGMLFLKEERLWMKFKHFLFFPNDNVCFYNGTIMEMELKKDFEEKT